MNLEDVFGAVRGIPSTNLKQGLDSIQHRLKKISILFEQRKWPEEGWDDLTIEFLINHLAALDSNNFVKRGGVGEREGRIFSDIVAKRHFNLAHGVGRSGDLTEIQPKATGSSIVSILANGLLLDFVKRRIHKVEDVALIPMATGMTLSLILLTIKKEKPNAKYVIWSRIDQKSCFKCIITAGLIPVIVEQKYEGLEMRSDIEKIENSIKELGVENIVSVLSTTSCFAPRTPDLVDKIAVLCKTYEIHHVVNNAYGIQSKLACNLIKEALIKGRLDAFVQSSDKNLMVPVGGCIVATKEKNFMKKITATYAGRASESQHLDILITILSMGTNKYDELIASRVSNFTYLKEELEKFGQKFNEKLLPSQRNDISIAISLKSTEAELSSQDGTVIKEVGSMLFLRNVSGARVNTPQSTQTIDGYEFKGWGNHRDDFEMPYLTAAAAIGMEKREVDYFIEKLEETMLKIKKRCI